TAFKVHPYHHATLGWKTDLATMPREDLYGPYKTFYTPNNAVIVAAGDFFVDDMLNRIRKAFGSIPRGPAAPPVKVVEPKQEGERRVHLRRPGPTSYFHAAYHGPKASDPDFFPVFVLSCVLSGVGGMSFSGGGSPGRSSRLYRALVETELATDVGCGFRPTIDPGTIDATATVRPRVPVEKVERAIFAELDKIASKPVTDAELAKVLKQARSQFVYATDGVMNRGYWLGELEIVASYKMYDTFLDQIASVTKADVQRVAAKYLVETNRTVGWFEPADGVAARRTPKASAKKRVRR
ncbi:MAG TPA: pitrilysin family protein, partial [Anaerolineae bacterium]